MHNEISQSVFKVTTGMGSGSSFYLADKKVFVTNYHVVGSYQQVCLEDATGKRYAARVVLVNPHEDIAFLKINENHLSASLSIHDAEDWKQGDKVFVAGYPFGMPFTITEGVVSAPRQNMNGRVYIQTDAAVNPGNSGGPIVNQSGRVIGITTSKFNEADNMGFAVPVSALKEEFEGLGKLEGDAFRIVCDSCASLILERSEYCNDCGKPIDVSYFDEPSLTDIGVFCEETISNLGINPVLTRRGGDFWEFHVGSSLVRLFVFRDNYLYATSPINELPTQNVGPFLEEIVSDIYSPYLLGIYQKDLFLSYRVYLSDLFSSHRDEISKNITEFFRKANELDDYFVNKFGCKLSVWSSKN
jgi:serine protease Do